MNIRFCPTLLSALLLASTAAANEIEQLQILLSGAAEDIRVVSLDSNCDRDSYADKADLSTGKSHGITILDAQTDRIIWQLDSMASAVCADITAVDTNQDGYIDRLYFSSTAGQLWRVELESQDRDLWTAQLLLELSPGQPFFTSPDVVVSQDGTYYGVIIGSAGKQQALQNTIIFYRDYCLHAGAPDCSTTKKSLADLQQLTNPNLAQQPLDEDKYKNGWYLPLAPGEATVTRAVTNNYTTLVATFSRCLASQCKTPGESRIYYFNPFHFDPHPKLESKPYYRLVESSEPLDEPVPFILLPDPPSCNGQGCSPHGAIIGGFSFGDSQQHIELPELGLIVKTWWHNHRDD